MVKLLNSIMLWLTVGILLLLFASSCTRYQGTSIRLLDDMDINYEITDNLPRHVRADAVYVEIEDKIYVKRGKQQIYLILHEVIHKFRNNAHISLGWDKDNHKLEEAIAVLAALEICKLAKISSGVSKYQIPGLISRTWKVNSLDRTPLTRSQKLTVEVEVKKSVELFIYELKRKGYDVRDVDWGRTAILILL